jgi:cytochrome oxidase assembly protein ShyY1
VAIHLLTVTIVVLFALFGIWQLHRWEGRGTTVSPPDARPAVALSELVSPDRPLPGGSIGRQTTVTGRYDGANQVLIAEREQDGRPGFWVVTPVLPDTSPGTSGAPGSSSAPGTSGAAALVVRGWVPAPDDPALTAPGGPITVTGRVYASEDLPPVGTEPPAALPPGQFRQVNTAELTGHFPYRLLDGYVLLATQQPASAASPAVVPVPVTEVDSGGGLRNLAYALQWWLFALAVLYFWSKLIRDDLAPEDDRVHEPAGPVPAARTTADPPPRAAEPAAASSAGSGQDEDAELAAYNRYLADLHARSGRRS